MDRVTEPMAPDCDSGGGRAGELQHRPAGSAELPAGNFSGDCDRRACPASLRAGSCVPSVPPPCGADQPVDLAIDMVEGLDRAVIGLSRELLARHLVERLLRDAGIGNGRALQHWIVQHMLAEHRAHERRPSGSAARRRLVACHEIRIPVIAHIRAGICEGRHQLAGHEQNWHIDITSRASADVRHQHAGGGAKRRQREVAELRRAIDHHHIVAALNGR